MTPRRPLNLSNETEKTPGTLKLGFVDSRARESRAPSAQPEERKPGDGLLTQAATALG